jgi:hypothetical protein
MFRHSFLAAMPKWVPPVLILLLASFLRWHGLAAMESMLMYDEAYNLWDALLLIESPRLTPFIPHNFGRESGWHYFLIPFLLTLGVRPLVAHFAASLVGILTVAAVYRLGKELFNRETAVWSALALTVLYIHIHLSHIGLRAILYPLVGTLAITALLYAHRKNATRSWLMGGFWLGILMYTYFSARLWLAYVGLWLLFVWLRHSRQRLGATLAVGLTSLIALPQLIYTLRYPAESIGRMGGVATTDLQPLIANVVAWLSAWTIAGDANADMNLSYRPILDTVLAVIFLAGLAAWLWRPTAKVAFWVLGLGLISLLPSVLSDFPPNHLRAIGLVVPTALLLGLGMSAIQQQVSARLPALARYGPLLGLACFAWAGFNSYTDFNHWLAAGRVESGMEMYINESVLWLDENLPDDERAVYFSPFSPYHPNIAILRYRLEPRVVSGFVASRCLIVPDEPALLVNVPAFQHAFTDWFGGWADLTRLYQSDHLLNERPLYEIYEMQPALAHPLSLPAESPVFNDGVQVQFGPVPEQVAAGETIPVVLALRAHTPQPKIYSAFIHLHGDPSPYEGGEMWANSSEWLCQSHPAPEWRADELIVQNIFLTIPPETPPGQYEVALGLFESPNGPRLTLTAPHTNENNYFVISTVQVVE